ncbi:MAG: hypothetical protein RL753_276, partial [Bacteroidota bacterium]
MPFPTAKGPGLGYIVPLFKSGCVTGQTGVVSGFGVVKPQGSFGRKSAAVEAVVGDGSALDRSLVA